MGEEATDNDDNSDNDQQSLFDDNATPPEGDSLLDAGGTDDKGTEGGGDEWTAYEEGQKLGDIVLSKHDAEILNLANPKPTDGTEVDLPKWMADDPDFKKYKSPEAIGEAYKTLQKKLSQSRNPAKVPDSYAEFIPEGLDISEEILGSFKDSGFTGEQTKAALELYKGQLGEISKRERAVELKQLGVALGVEGAELQSRLQGISKYAVEKFGSSEAAEPFFHDHRTIMALEKMKATETNNHQIDTGSHEGEPKMTEADLLDYMRSVPDYSTNAAAKAKAARMSKKIAANAANAA